MPRTLDLRLRRGTAATWTSTNPVLNSGEIGVETDTRLLKVGDGATVWASLPYMGAGQAALTWGIITRSLTAAGPALSSVTTEQLLGVTFTIPAGSLAVGDTAHVHAAGSLTQAVVAGNCTARARVGAVGSGLSGAVAANALSPLNASAAGAHQFVIDAYLTVRTIGAGGTIIGDIHLSGPAFNLTGAAVLAPITTPVAINTTVAQDITLTIQQSAANFTAGNAQTGFIRRVA